MESTVARRFSFRLQAVLDLRQQQYRELERQAMQLMADRRRFEQRINQLQTMIEETSLSSRPGVPISPAEVVTCSKYVARLGEEVSVAESERMTLQQKLQEKRQELTASRQQIDCLESLRERKLASHKKSCERGEQLDIEDTITRRWSRQE